MRDADAKRERERVAAIQRERERVAAKQRERERESVFVFVLSNDRNDTHIRQESVKKWRETGHRERESVRVCMNVCERGGEIERQR